MLYLLITYFFSACSSDLEKENYAYSNLPRIRHVSIIAAVIILDSIIKIILATIRLLLISNQNLNL